MSENIRCMGRLDDAAFKVLIRNAPLVSIDLVVRTEGGRYLLGLRKNRPAKDNYFVLGGRIYKNETIEQAFQHITKAELGIQKKLDEAIFLGAFTHIYEKDSYYDELGINTHYVVLAYELVVEKEEEISPPKNQHHQYVWWTIDQIRTSSAVHKNTNAYLRLDELKSEAQYKELSTRRNASNSLLWSTPALSLTAIAFLLNVAGNANTYWPVRAITSVVAFLVAIATLQLFLRHRMFEEQESKLLSSFEVRNRHLGYVHVNRPCPGSTGIIDYIYCLLFLDCITSWLKGIRSHKVWALLFCAFMIVASYLLYINLYDRDSLTNPDKLADVTLTNSVTITNLVTLTNLPAQLNH